MFDFRSQQMLVNSLFGGIPCFLAAYSCYYINKIQNNPSANGGLFRAVRHTALVLSYI